MWKLICISRRRPWTNIGRHFFFKVVPDDTASLEPREHFHGGLRQFGSGDSFHRRSRWWRTSSCLASTRWNSRRMFLPQWAIPSLFFFIFVISIVQLVDKILLMTGFELRISGVGCDCSTNWATTTALKTHVFATMGKLPEYRSYHQSKAGPRCGELMSCWWTFSRCTGSWKVKTVLWTACWWPLQSGSPEYWQLEWANSVELWK